MVYLRTYSNIKLNLFRLKSLEAVSTNTSTYETFSGDSLPFLPGVDFTKGNWDTSSADRAA